MGMPAIREGDPCSCVPHFHAAALAAPPPRRVHVNGKPIVVQTDTCGCKMGPAIVAVGSGTVRVNGLGPARAAETSILTGGHLGTFLIGSSNVRIGGPAIVGDLDRWVKACLKARHGRASFHRHRRVEGAPSDYRNPPDKFFPDNSPHQQGNNCGLEAMRTVIQEYQGIELDEWEFMQKEIDAGHADWRSDEMDTDEVKKAKARSLAQTPEARAWREVNPEDAGATHGPDFEPVLSSNGVDAVDIHDPKKPCNVYEPGAKQRQRVDEVTATVADGRPVIAKVDGSNSNHVILIVAVELDSGGNPAFFYINDSASGACGQRVPVSDYTSSKNKEFMSVPQIAPAQPPPPRR